MKSTIFFFVIFTSQLWAIPKVRPAKVGEQNILCEYAASDLQSHIGKMQLEKWEYKAPYWEKGEKKWIKFRYPVSIVTISSLPGITKEPGACALIMQR